MVKVDLITGFLGSGKTTFIKKYAAWLMSQGQNIGILENDFGAVNVDMMLLHDLEGENCELEMVSGGCDADCHRSQWECADMTGFSLSLPGFLMWMSFSMPFMKSRWISGIRLEM